MAFVDDMQNKNGRKFLSGDLDFFLAGGGHTRKMLDGEMWGSRSGDSAIRDTRMMEWANTIMKCYYPPLFHLPSYSGKGGGGSKGGQRPLIFGNMQLVIITFAGRNGREKCFPNEGSWICPQVSLIFLTTNLASLIFSSLPPPWTHYTGNWVKPFRFCFNFQPRYRVYSLTMCARI